LITALNYSHFKIKKEKIYRKKKRKKRDSRIISEGETRKKGADGRSRYVFFYKFAFTLILHIMHFKVLPCTHFIKKKKNITTYIAFCTQPAPRSHLHVEPITHTKQPPFTSKNSHHATPKQPPYATNNHLKTPPK